MNAADVAFALELDLEAISKRLHSLALDPDCLHMRDVDTILYAPHSLREYIDPSAMRAHVTPTAPDWATAVDGLDLLGDSLLPGHDDDAAQAIHDVHLHARTPG